MSQQKFPKKPVNMHNFCEISQDGSLVRKKQYNERPEIMRLVVVLRSDFPKNSTTLSSVQESTSAGQNRIAAIKYSILQTCR